MPLLRLSQDTRHRIYRYLGLASWDGQPYRFCLQGARVDYNHRHYDVFGSRAPNPSLFHGLLLCCRGLYVETAALLYSTNLFILHYSDLNLNPPGRAGAQPPLQALYDLTPSAFLSLSHLKIVINESSCHQPVLDSYPLCCPQGPGGGYATLGNAGEDWHHEIYHHTHQSPLLSLSSTDDHHDHQDQLVAAHSVLADWHSAATHLFSHVPPGRLALSLVCDIDPRHSGALDIAEAVVAPLNRLPRSYLRECNLRLAKSTDYRFRQLAQETVFHTVGVTVPVSSQPSNTVTTFTNLPRELRIRILEYTDLITPRKDVIWSREHRAYTVMFVGWDSGDMVTSDVHYGSQLFSCWDATNVNNGQGTTSGCFCRRHAAFSFTCQCWAPPGPALFLVCRALCDDARFVFFSGNRFTVHDYKLAPPWELPMLGQDDHDGPVPTYPYPYERFVVSDFLRNVPTCALTHLRLVDIIFPPYRAGSWPEREHPVMQDWWATVDWLRGKINPQALTLRLIVSDMGDAPTPYHRTITNREGDVILEAFLNLSQPLAALGKDGLAQFYAHLPYPWQCTEETRARRGIPWNRDWVEREEGALKERVERFVMGDRYESLYANGKKEPEYGDMYELYQSGYL